MFDKLYITAWMAFLILVTQTHASELVYTPINPSFGGSPLNSSHLFTVANGQNDNKDPNSASRLSKSELEAFNDRIQRLVLSQVASAVSRPIVGSGGELVPGTVTTEDFVITVEDLGGDSLRITTLEKLTGEETIFELNQSP